MDWEKTSSITIGDEKPVTDKKPIVDDRTIDLKAWREAAEAALLRGQTNEALRTMERVIELGGGTQDRLTKAELLCAAGEFEKCMLFTEENMDRFEAELTAREKKNRLDSIIRKVAEWLLRTTDEMFTQEQFEECAAFSQQVLLQHSAFIKMKKYKELFEFAWRSSYDAVLRRLFTEGDYENCIFAVNVALSNYRSLTTFGQRGRYRKIRALSYFRLKQYGKGLLDYLSVPGVQLFFVFVALLAVGMIAGMNMFRGGELPQRVKDAVKAEAPAEKVAAPATPAVTPASPPVVKNAIRRAEIKSLKLFEADTEVPAVGARTYSDRFSPQAKRIFVEVLYKNYNYRVADVTLPLVVRYYTAAGALLHEMPTTSSPKKEYESAITSVGWRPEGAGWKTGKYIVRVALDGEAVQEATFEIK